MALGLSVGQLVEQLANHFTCTLMAIAPTIPIVPPLPKPSSGESHCQHRQYADISPRGTVRKLLCALLPYSQPANIAPFFTEREFTGPMGEKFTLGELEAALQNLHRKSAAGPDGVSNQALLNIPTETKPWLLAHLNDI